MPQAIVITKGVRGLLLIQYSFSGANIYAPPGLCGLDLSRCLACGVSAPRPRPVPYLSIALSPPDARSESFRGVARAFECGFIWRRQAISSSEPIFAPEHAYSHFSAHFLCFRQTFWRFCVMFRHNARLCAACYAQPLCPAIAF